jgi:hypothetical protein
MRRSPLLAALVFACCILGTHGASAQDGRAYGTRGRTVINAAAGALGSNLKLDSNRQQPDPFHTYKWSAGLSLSLVQFVRDNIGIGGTLYGGATQRVGLHDKPTSASMGADFDLVFHVPASTWVSVRFWISAGVLYALYTDELYVDASHDTVPGARHTRVSLIARLTPDLLIHLSPSVALALGIGLELRVAQGGHVEGGLPIKTGLTYSFGPSPRDADERSRLDAAARFSSRSRNVLTGSVALADRRALQAFIGYARFVHDRVAIGGYATGSSDDGAETLAFGGGAQALFHLPIAREFSVVAPLGVGYMWRRAHSSLGGHRKVHELQVRVPVYLALHLHEALLFGMGPILITDIRLKQEHSLREDYVWMEGKLARFYVAGGLASVLMASF